MEDKILEVKNLKVSFRTQTGTLKAVRDISFDLHRGKTLCIVGESGSGKSVTSKAILGILAGNSILEGGEILYDGRDLLKLDEEQMTPIRGDKISMIFQDPLSALNPIVRIGKQITEAMLLKNKSGRKNSKKEFDSMLKLLEENMIAACPDQKEKIQSLIKTFDNFTMEATKLEDSYNRSESTAESLIEEITNFNYLAEKKQKQDVKALVNEYRSLLKKLTDEFFIEGYETKLKDAGNAIDAAVKLYKPDKDDPHAVNVELTSALDDLRVMLEEMTQQTAPNFFRLGYLKTHYSKDILPKGVTSRPELDEFALDVMNKEFMNEFIEYEEKGVEYSHKKAIEAKKAALVELAAAKEYFEGEIDKKEAKAVTKKTIEAVKAGIDLLEINKDPYPYTFDTSMKAAVDKYFEYVKRNPKEQKRFDKQTAKHDKQIAKGKKVDWKVVPLSLLDLDALKADIVKIISKVEERYQANIAETDDADYVQKAVNIVDYLKDRASKAVYVITKDMAKRRAIKLMEEVGIPEPRLRYTQYPFEFSGGMRQRIVIAIALAADPEILICDEPTTALDVTIQAQILELINNLKEERNLSIIFITHDLGVVANMADEIAVMYAGKIVEQGTADDIFYDPRHPYTWALLSSMPDLDTTEKLESIPGTPPNMVYPPVGDAFADRNKYAMQIDFEQQPPMFEISETHKAATWLLHPDAPKVAMPEIVSARIERMKAKALQKEAQNG